MIKHIVLFKVRTEITSDEFEGLMHEIAVLKSVLTGFIDFKHGPNKTPETKDQGYTYGFILTLGSWKDLESYQNNPSHQATGAKLVSACHPSDDGILVFDMEVGDEL